MRFPTHSAASRQGFTLLEVMISGVVLVLMFLSALSALQQGFKMMDTARNTTIASQVIQSEIEDLRLKPWATITAIPAESAIDISQSIAKGLTTSEGTALAQRFSATRLIADVPDHGSNLKRVTIAVSWADASGVRHTQSYETFLGHFGLSDYFVAEHGT